MAFYQEELPKRCSSCELPGATGGIRLLKVLCYLCCSFVYLHFVDCHRVLLSTLRHSLGFVPTNHRQLSFPIIDQLWPGIRGGPIYSVKMLRFTALVFVEQPWITPLVFQYYYERANDSTRLIKWKFSIYLKARFQ